MKTPQLSYPSLATALGVSALYLKREDLHPYGSHKGRSIPNMIYNYVRDGVHEFVISSSGNAALAAMMAVREYNEHSEVPITLTVYIGIHIPESKQTKLNALTSAHCHIKQVERPKQSAFQAAKQAGGVVNLRQSTDDTALFGYHELAFELAEIPHLAAVFIPTSSGTTAQGIAEAFDETEFTPQIHIVQTTDCHPIATALGAISEETQEPSLAGAIVDNVAHRKARVAEIVTETQGSGWIITNDEIIEAMCLVKEHTNITLSANSALSVAAVKKAVERGWEFGGSVVCLVSGG